jgi:hypothetical protein
MRISKVFIVFVIFLSLLLALRLALPSILLHYVSTQLNKIPQYKAKIKDIDISLIEGSYTINSLQLWKMNKRIPLPFFSADKIHFAIEWKALLYGKLVANIDLYQPELHFVVDPQGKQEQLTIDKIWIDIVKRLFPLNFNKITVEKGFITFQSFTSKPPFELALKNIHGQLQNMRNVTRSSHLLSSTFDIHAQTTDNAAVNIQGKFNPFTPTPTFYLAGSIAPTRITLLKNFLNYYTGVNVKEGRFSVFTEITGAQGKIKGYVKPFIKELEIAPPPHASPLKVIYNGVAAVVAKIVKNPKQDTIAARVPFEGRVDSPNVSILSTVFSVLRHAFIQALFPQIDHSIQINQIFKTDRVFYQQQNSGKTKE